MATVSLGVGDFHVGVRVNAADVGSRLRSELADIVVHDAEAPANYSILSGPSSPSGEVASFRIYAGCKHVFTTDSVHRAIAVLVGYIHDFLPESQRQQRYLRMVGLALVHECEAILIPWQLRHRSPSLERRLARDDVRLLESTTVLVDADRQQLVVPPWRIAAAPSATGAPRGFLAERTPPGRYQLRAWCVTLRQSRPELSSALAVAHGMTIAHHRGRPRDTLTSLAALVADLPVLPISNSPDLIEFARATWSESAQIET